MKIVKPDNLVKPSEKTILNKNQVEDNKFHDIFTKAVNNETKVEKTNQNSLPEIQPVNFNIINDDPSDILTDKLHKTLDLLETYSDKLKNPDVNLKKVEENLNLLIKEAENLNKGYNEEKKKNPEIKNIINEILITAKSEQIKMLRGDYI